MDGRIESLGAQTPQRKAARAVALWAVLDALPENDPSRFEKAREAYVEEPDGSAE